MRNQDMSVSRSESNWIDQGAGHCRRSSDRALVAMRAMRRKLVGAIGVVMLASAALVFPFAVIELLSGQATALFFAVLVLVFASYSVAVARLGRTNLAVHIQGGGIFLGGLVLTIADPAILDFGLALMFLTPVHMILLCGQISKKTTWWIMASLAIFAGISTSSLMPLLLHSNALISWLGVFSCTIVAASQIFAAYRLHHVEGAQERKQTRAIQHLVEHMGDGYLRLSSDGQVLFASKRTEEIFGSPRYELTGNGLFERVHILDRPDFLNTISRAIHNAAPQTVEARLRKDNLEHNSGPPQFIWIEFSFSPVVNAGIAQTDWELVALLRDVSNRKDHEFEMMTARKLAEEASRSKSRFLASIGHELRTPLNAIVGFSEMMSSGIGGQLEPTHLEYASLIQQSGHHLLEVVNMLLDMSKLEAGKFELQLASFEPVALARPCMEIVRPVALKNNVTLVADVPETLPAFVGDERACRQILINLLSNAVKFSHAGGKVSLRAKRQGQYLNMSVSDNGIGMSPEASKRVGDPFFQAHDGLSRQYEGTGLGLSIVKGLVKLHGGSLRIDSTLGEGTTVTVLLPLSGPQKSEPPAEKITPLHQKTQEIQDIKELQEQQWPEQKSVAL
ncbi:Two-component system sensor histidine kinase [hydrothermal vent metagenome]|uniref:histidine kinase n=1 Tax=hydrothermal vent metagenome TaxID=652676 RepID=A0A3B0TIG8_9ZZZZ